MIDTHAMTLKKEAILMSHLSFLNHLTDEDEGSEINKQIILKSLAGISKFSFHQANQIFHFIIQVGRID